MSHWKLGRRHPACLRCQRPFGEGEAHYSVLAASPEALERLDLCHACWPAEQQTGAAGRAWWRARRPLGQRRGLAVDLEGLEALFHALAEACEERLRELRYVLSLLLLRKRRLFLVRATVRALPGSDQRGEFLVVRRPRRKEEEFFVQVYDLAAGRMESLRADLERLFEGAGLDDLAGAPQAEAPASGAAAGVPGEGAPGDADLGGGAPAQAGTLAAEGEPFFGAPSCGPQEASGASAERDPAGSGPAREPQGCAGTAVQTARENPAEADPEAQQKPRTPVRRVARRAAAAPRGLPGEPGLHERREPPSSADSARGLAAG
jgi:hypothetical protein